VSEGLRGESALGFWKIAAENPDHLALVDPDGVDVRAGDLLASTNQVAQGLRARGLEKGDAVAVVLPNSREVFEVYLAAMQIGLYFTPINFHLTAPEIAYIVGDCDAKAVVCSSRFADACAAAVEELGFPKDARFAVGDIDGFRSFDELKDGQPATLPDNRVAGQAMNYTSGTSGKPKGVRRAMSDIDPDTSAELFTMLLSLFGIQAHDDNVHLVPAPLYHTAALQFGSNSLHFGHTLSLMDKWTAESTLAHIQRDRVTTTHMVPTMFHRLLALPDDVKQRYDVSSLRVVIHSAAPCPVDVKRRMLEWWGPVIYEYYAATEGGGTLVTPEQWLQKPGTVGTPWPISDVKIFDDDGNELPPREIGTVYMSMGQAVTFEYHGDKDKTAASRRENFFTVGDAGYLDEDGWLFLADRKSDMIISGGVNIYPAEIESVLLTHPKIGDAAVFGIPDDDWGEQVKAVIEPAEGVEGSPELAADILAFCADKVAKYKTPKTIDFVPELPRDPNGKLYKRKLRDPYWEGRERAI
jgi:long-chain acyl-CoA synthetase